MKAATKARMKIAICIVTLLMITTAFAVKNEFQYRVMWDQGSMQRLPAQFKELITKSASHGYNTMMFVDYDLQKIEEQPQKFFTKYKDVIAHAKRHKIELAPWTLWQGFPAYENYNLSESFPVKGTQFVVSGNEARAVADHNTGLENGGFESAQNGRPAGWSLSRLNAANSHLDKTTRKSGNSSFCVKSVPAHARLYQKINVKPYRAYQISAWFKTQGLRYPNTVKFYVDPHLLARYDRPFGNPRGRAFSGNQNWRKCVTDFNSLKETSITLTLWLATGGAQQGNIWIDDIEVREVGLYETMRGKSRPLVVKNADGSTTYAEGKDYIVDPKCSSMTLETYDYEGHLKIPSGSAIQSGQKLRVDWFQYANVRTIVAPSDFCLPKTWETMKDNVKRIDNLMGTVNALYSKYGEYRIGAWSQDCECFKFKTGGEYLANIQSGSECVLRSIGNGCPAIFSDSDMYDPYFNGYNGPYGTWYGPDPYKGSSKGAYGGTYGAFKGLGSDMIIINWNTPFGQAYTDSSLLFFDGKDSKYPDVKTKQILNVLDAGAATKWCNTLDRLEKKGLDGVVGAVYTDWYGGTYNLMGPVANAFKARGRWPNNPFPNKSCAPIDPQQCKGPSISESQRKLGANVRISIMTATSASGITSIQYAVPKFGQVSLKAFDLMGREVETLVSKTQKIGTHRISWNTSTLSAGMYVLRLTVDGVGEQTLKHMVF